MRKRPERLAAFLTAAVILASVLSVRAGGAGDLNDYATCSFSRSFPVYTGPGEEYFRVGGNAKYGSGSCRVWGADGDWLMIGFLVKSGKYRVGYVTRDALGYAVNVSGDPDRELSFLYETAKVVRGGAPLTDDPVLDNERYCYMKEGQEVTVLGYYGNWAYVETNITTSRRGRGFVRKFNLDFTRSGTPFGTEQTAPTPCPTAVPAAATPVPTVGNWGTPGGDMTAGFSAWVPQTTARPEYEEAAVEDAAWPAGDSLLLGLSHNCPNTGVMLPESFDPYVSTYVLTVASWVSRVRFTPTASDGSAYITVNGEYVASGGTSSYIALTNDPKKVEIVVWGAGGSQRMYTVFLQRRPSEKTTRVAVGFIRGIRESGGKWILSLDPVEETFGASDYLSGSRSSWTDPSAAETQYTVDPHCELWYGTPEDAHHADDVPSFEAVSSAEEPRLYYVVLMEDAVVAVMPYEAAPGY